MSDARPFNRAIVIVLDSVGIGELPDAGAYGDQGSHTLGNVCRRVRLQVPTLLSMGLSQIVALPGLSPAFEPSAAYGKMAEASPGKDSVTGHWELMGVVLERAFPVFRDGFPEALIQAFEGRIGRTVLGNVVASGTRVIEDFGTEHLRTRSPIVYTSADSVFQIAAHEEVVPVWELYQWCRIAYEIASDGYGVGRIIARPFVGRPGSFRRTSNRRDFARPPAGETLLDLATAAGLPVVAIGKIEDLFAGRGISEAIHTANDDEVMDAVEAVMDRLDRGLIFANLVDFDTVYGHRNDPEGYGANLERFDARLAEVIARLRPEDLLMVTADHGNDPTTAGTDHSREYVPLLVTGPRCEPGINLGVRSTFADVGQSLADVFGLARLSHGTSFLPAILSLTGAGR